MMAAAANERAPQKICFLDWLIKAINSRTYKGLYWLDDNCSIFRIPWKHNSRKDLDPNDYMIFKAWAIVSRKYNKDVQDPAKWKTNFRCALNSTKRFEEVTHMWNEPDCHMYRVIPAQPNNAPTINLPVNTNNGSNPNVDELLHANPYNGARDVYKSTSPAQGEVDDAFRALTLENPGPNGNPAGNIGCDTLQWVIQQSQLNLDGAEPISWAPTPSNHPVGETLCEQNSAYTVPQIDQNGYQPLTNERLKEPVTNNCYEEPLRWLVQNNVNSQSAATLPLQQTQQNSPITDLFNHVGDVLYDNNCFIDNVFMDEEPEGNGVIANNATRNDCHLGTGQQPMMEEGLYPQPVESSTEQPLVNSVPLQNNIGVSSLPLDVSIYYKESLLSELGVEASNCVFTYSHHHDHVLGNSQIIEFPSPKGLLDRKQIHHTCTVLQNAGLLLYRLEEKLYARRLGKSKVYWAFSKQLNNVAEHPHSGMLPRNEDIEIFNYTTFCQELWKFKDGHISSFPDYTIYLCFGQRIFNGKPKESKLILVKLVPRFCKCQHEQLLMKGASSLNIENDSLQISNSLFEMMEYLTTIFVQSREAH